MKGKSKRRTTFREFIAKMREKIQSEEFLDSSRVRPQDFTRNRKMPFFKLVMFMLNAAKSSIQTRLDDFFENVTKEDMGMTQQSFSEARQKISYSAFPELFAYGVEVIYEGGYDTWHGYRLSAVDGSKIQLPDNQELREQFGTMGSDNSAATAQASALYDVLNNVLIDVRIAPLWTDERTLALKHIRTLCGCSSFGLEAILYDRGYASFELVETHKERGISFVMRVKHGFNKTIDQLGKGDHEAILQKQGRDDINVRVLKFDLSSGEEETLITDIADKGLGIEDFKKLYFMRWPIETKYDEIKNKLQVENFSGWTVKTIIQDFYISMFLSNAIAVARWEAQSVIDEQGEDKDNKYDYHVNANHSVGVFKDRFIRAMLEDNPRRRAKQMERILFLLTKKPAPTRPDRSLPRNKSPRKAKFRHNRKSNC
jgi:hypothetical protein